MEVEKENVQSDNFPAFSVVTGGEELKSNYRKVLEERNQDLKEKFITFLTQFSKRRENDFCYKTQLIDHYLKKKKFIDINIDDIVKFDSNLAEELVKNPFQLVSVFEQAVNEVVFEAFPEDLRDSENLDTVDIQVLLHSERRKKTLRTLSADRIYNVLAIPGIAVSVSPTRPRPISLVFICRKCRKRTPIQPNEDKICHDINCNSRDLMNVAEEGTFVDQQYIKLQEAPEEVPTGEIPRTITILCERRLVDRVTPGARIVVTGVQGLVSASKDKKKGSASLREVSSCMIHALGIQLLDTNRSFYFSQEDEEAFLEFAKTPKVHEKIFKSIAPQISGSYTDDIKKAIACLLFGGTQRILQDRTKLRGDINVLLIGDPSTAKSQFLKFTHKASPIGVYTSGKGSSAAGLTAAVLRDAKGEFYVEGGAMVLADGGVVCIDEFDKMRDQDRVAIHEAMEQQTISIAKAGITTQLNSRTSVLAAANPVFGTYDDFKSSAENIDFLPTILSRFDLIFIVKDVRNAKRDFELSSHILNLHTGGSKKDNKRKKSKYSQVKSHLIDNSKQMVDVEFLKRYISYCRSHCRPTLNDEAAELLVNNYVSIREEANKNSQRNQKTKLGGQGSTVPITVRQLEAIARIAESLAKMELQTEVKVKHITEALRLFRVATVNANATGKATGDMSLLEPDDIAEIESVEAFVKTMLPIGSKAPQKRIMRELVEKRGYSRFSVRKAFQIMLAKKEIKHIFQQKYVQRVI